MATRTSPTQHVFRQPGSLWLAGAGAATGLFLLVSIARSWADEPQPLFAAWVVFVLSVVWATFVRPAVALDVEGVTLCNIVRDVHIPWARVSDVGFRWNLKVFVGDNGYTAWAISSSVERPKGGSGGVLGMLSGRLDRFADADAASSTPAPKVTAAAVAGMIEQARLEYGEAVAQGALPAAPDAQVRVTLAPQVIVLLLVTAVAVVALTLT